MLKKILFIAGFISWPLSAQLTPTLRQTTKYSVRELQDWLKKQDRPNYVIPSRYTITGQVTAKWKNVHETLNGENQIGSGTGSSNNQYNLDTELQFIYAFGRTYGNARINFKNAGGLFNGSANSIGLTRAFMCYHFLTYGPHTLDLYVGRRDLNKMYNSMMMFRSYGDGVSLFAFYQWKKYVEYQLYAGLYTSNPASYWIVRGRLFNIANLGFYFDYDYIYWGKVKPSSNLTQIKTQYGISQFLIGWERTPKWLGTNIQFFAALILNSRAQRHPLSHNELANLAGYVGVQYGTVKNPGDFSFQGQLQFCELQAIPEWDMAGIGRGNIAKGSLFKASDLRSVNGDTNFQGFELKLNYALTKQITIATSFQRSVNLSDNIGKPSAYSNYSLSTTYIF